MPGQVWRNLLAFDGLPVLTSHYRVVVTTKTGHHDMATDRSKKHGSSVRGDRWSTPQQERLKALDVPHLAIDRKDDTIAGVDPYNTAARRGRPGTAAKEPRKSLDYLRKLSEEIKKKRKLKAP